MLPHNSVFTKGCRQYSAECVNTLMLTLFLGSTPLDVCLQTNQFRVKEMFHLMSAYKQINFWSGKMFHLMSVYKAIFGQGNVLHVCLQTKQFLVREMFHLMSVYKATSGQGYVLPDIFYKSISIQGNVSPDFHLQTKQFLVKEMFHLMTAYKATSGQGNVLPNICLQTKQLWVREMCCLLFV